MTEDPPPQTVPSLRFPEFVDSPAWQQATIQGTAPLVNERVPVEQIQLTDYVSTENLLPDFGGVSPATRLPPTGSATRYQPDDILLANIRPYLRKAWRSNRFGGASNDVIVMRPSRGVDPRFFEHVVKNDAFIAYVMKTAKGVKMPRGDLDSIRDYAVYRPAREEQQKIADCLGSLDDLIAAEGRKLEALRRHKKGLMQQLFPQPGETVPRLRFPEFEDGPEWRRQTLGQAARFLNGRAYSKDELLDSGTYRVLRVGNFFTNDHWYYSDLELDEDKYCDNGDLLYAWSASFGPRIWRGERVIYHYHIWKVVEREGIDRGFLYACLDFETQRMRDASARGLGMQHLTKAGIESWECAIPPDRDEQRRISECLAAADAGVEAQGTFLDSLQRLKRGLLQQLFPRVEDDAS